MLKLGELTKEDGHINPTVAKVTKCSEVKDNSEDTLLLLPEPPVYQNIKNLEFPSNSTPLLLGITKPCMVN